MLRCILYSSALALPFFRQPFRPVILLMTQPAKRHVVFRIGRISIMNPGPVASYPAAFPNAIVIGSWPIPEPDNFVVALIQGAVGRRVSVAHRTLGK